MVAHQRDPLDHRAGQRFQALISKLVEVPAHRRSVWDRRATQRFRDLLTAWTPLGETVALRQRRVVSRLDVLLNALRPVRRHPGAARRIQVVDRRTTVATTDPGNRPDVEVTRAVREASAA